MKIMRIFFIFIFVLFQIESAAKSNGHMSWERQLQQQRRQISNSFNYCMNLFEKAQIRGENWNTEGRLGDRNRILFDKKTNRIIGISVVKSHDTAEVYKCNFTIGQELDKPFSYDNSSVEYMYTYNGDMNVDDDVLLNCSNLIIYRREGNKITGKEKVDSCLLTENHFGGGGIGI